MENEQTTRGGWVPTGTAARRRERSSTPLTPKGQRTREHLIASAHTVFDRMGYIQASIDDIVKEAGLARGSFYTYFPSKLEIFREIVRRMDAAIYEAVSTQPGDVRKDIIFNLDRAHRRYFGVYREYGAIYGLAEQMATVDPEYRHSRLIGRQRHVQRVTRSIERWQSMGLADPTIDAHTAAGALVSMISNFNYWRVVGHDDYDEEQAAYVVTEIWVRSLKLRKRPKRQRATPAN